MRTGYSGRELSTSSPPIMASRVPSSVSSQIHGKKCSIQMTMVVVCVVSDGNLTSSIPATSSIKSSVNTGTGLSPGRHKISVTGRGDTAPCALSRDNQSRQCDRVTIRECWSGPPHHALEARGSARRPRPRPRRGRLRTPSCRTAIPAGMSPPPRRNPRQAGAVREASEAGPTRCRPRRP